MSRRRTCVVISAEGVPLATISPERAIVNIEFKGTMYLVEAHPRKFMRSKDKVYPWPTIVGLVRHRNLPGHYYGAVPVSAALIKKRDKYRCQYCGRHESKLKKDEFLNIDHVFPQDRGGEHIWENVVSSCNTCNQKKSNRTPQEAGMTLLSKPFAPNRWQIFNKHVQKFQETTTFTKGEVDYSGALD